MLVLNEYRLVFADEFDSLSLAGTKTATANWYTSQAWGGSFGSARFLPASALNSPFSIVEKGGETALSIAMTRNAEGKLESGLISNTFPDRTSTTPQDGDPIGYYELRAWLPEGQGIWPAFWAIEEERLPSERDYVYEIDIMEHYGSAMLDRFTSHLHGWNWNKTSLEGHTSQYSRNVVGGDVLASGWHTYGLEVTATEVMFYFDGKPHFTVSKSAKLDTNLMFMIDLAAGGGWPIDPRLSLASMYVDYFRAYERKDVVSSVALLPTTQTGTLKNEVFDTDNSSALVPQLPPVGSDTVYSAVSYTLAANVERLVLSGKAAINGTGNDGNNRLDGNPAANVLSGCAGNDQLNGGYGNDALCGGTGQDAFIFSSKLGTFRTNRKLNLDVVKDFDVRKDTILLDNAVFIKLGKGFLTSPVTLKKENFRLGASKDSNDYIIYNRKTGVVSYDADGSGVKYKAIDFIQTQKSLTITHSDFFII
jgi:beta-glucanase (GH16 family)